MSSGLLSSDVSLTVNGRVLLIQTSNSQAVVREDVLKRIHDLLPVLHQDIATKAYYGQIFEGQSILDQLLRSGRVLPRFSPVVTGKHF